MSMTADFLKMFFLLLLIIILCNMPYVRLML